MTILTMTTLTTSHVYDKVYEFPDEMGEKCSFV